MKIKTNSPNWLLECSNFLHVTHCDDIEVIRWWNKDACLRRGVFQRIQRAPETRTLQTLPL